MFNSRRFVDRPILDTTYKIKKYIKIKKISNDSNQSELLESFRLNREPIQTW